MEEGGGEGRGRGMEVEELQAEERKTLSLDWSE